MIKLLKALALLAGTALMAVSLPAQIVYLQYSGTGSATASGAIDGAAFSGLDWTLEFGVDTSVADNSSDPNVGYYPGSIVSGNLRLGSTTYALAGNSITGAVQLTQVTGMDDYGSVEVLPDSGGSTEFRASAGSVVPRMFSDQNNFASLNVGASMTNTVPDGFNNYATVNFDYDPDPDGGHDYRLLTTDAHMIQLFAAAAAGSGDMTLTISATSMAPVPEPATVAVLIAAVCGGVAVLVRRRRRTN